MSQSFSTKNIIKESWLTVKSNLKFFALLTFIAWVIQFIPNYTSNQTTNQILNLVISLVSWVINTTVTLGLVTITLKFVKSGTAAFGDATAKMSTLLPYMLGSIYYSLIVLVGMILLIVPGVIFALRYQFFGYFIIDQGLKPKEALAKSKEITKGKLWQLFVFGLALFGINLVGVLALGIGLLVTIPLSMVAVAKLFYFLTGSQTAMPSPAVAASAQQTKVEPGNVWKSVRQN